MGILGLVREREAFEGKAFVFANLGFGVWLEKERHLREIFFLVKVEVFFSEMERPGGGLEKIGRLFFY